MYAVNVYANIYDRLKGPLKSIFEVLTQPRGLFLSFSSHER